MRDFGVEGSDGVGGSEFVGILRYAQDDSKNKQPQ
jgi:hypothetical protein